MSDVASASSACSSESSSSIGIGDSNESLQERVRRLQHQRSRLSRQNSQDSSNSSASDSPSRESISAALDKYIAASQEGREAYCSGDLQGAVKEFNQALDIELQTELDCLYDTSIGLVSGLVRSEVDVKLDQRKKGLYSTKCEHVLEQLREMYCQAAGELKAKKSDQQWYLKMGAALIIINEWKKAKAVYTEGINQCKDRKKLKQALKNLIKIEQMTSHADIPVEDQPDSNSLRPPPSPSRTSPYVSPHHSPRQSPKPSPHHSPANSPQIQPKRDRAMSYAAKQTAKKGRARTHSLNLEEASFKSNRKDSDPMFSHTLLNNSVTLRSPSVHQKKEKFSFNIFNSKRSSLVKASTALCLEETGTWEYCFEPDGCSVVNRTGFQPSAITHMRRLASLSGEEERTEEGGDGTLNSNFNAVKFTSMTIEDDDSELDESD